MFYSIKKIDDHPCYNMQQILETFFLQLSYGKVWDINTQHEELLRVHRGSNFVTLLEELYNNLLPTHKLVRGTIYYQFLNNNNIEKLCNNTLNICNSIQLDIAPIKEIKKFLQDSYPDKLDLGIFKRTGSYIKPTKSFYQEFIEQNGHICPFCSILSHKHPFGKKRSDFDHYIDKAHYPMAALNLDNLIPMCTECNQDYKHTANILKDENGGQKEFIYPYSIDETFTIKIESIIPTDSDWKFNVQITANMDKVLIERFDSVFKIKDRISRELNKRYDALLNEEAKRYTSSSGDITVNGYKDFLLNIAENVINLLDRTLEAKLLEYALFIFLAKTEDEEINEIFLKSYLFEDI